MDIMWVEPLCVCSLCAQGWNTSQVTSMAEMFEGAKAFNGDVSVLSVPCVFCAQSSLVSVCCCSLLCMDEWCVSGPCGRVTSIHIQIRRVHALGSRDKKRAVEDSFCFGHVCTSGGDTFHKEGRRKGQQEDRSKELGSSCVLLAQPEIDSIPRLFAG